LGRESLVTSRLKGAKLQKNKKTCSISNNFCNKAAGPNEF